MPTIDDICRYSWRWSIWVLFSWSLVSLWLGSSLYGRNEQGWLSSSDHRSTRHDLSLRIRSNAGRTAYGCCPPSYYCANNPQTCQSLATTGAVKVTSCTDYTETATSTITFPAIFGTTTVSTMTAYAPLIQIVFQSTDVKSAVTITPSADTGLDTGDRAAIGVGVVALVFLAVALILAAFLLRWRRTQKKWTPTGPNPPNTQPIYETPAKERNPAAETDGTPLTELADPHTDFDRSRWQAR